MLLLKNDKNIVLFSDFDLSLTEIIITELKINEKGFGIARK